MNIFFTQFSAVSDSHKYSPCFITHDTLPFGMKVVRRDEKKSKETFDGDDECTDGEIERSASARVAACDVGLFYVT